MTDRTGPIARKFPAGHIFLIPTLILLTLVRAKRYGSTFRRQWAAPDLFRA